MVEITSYLQGTPSWAELSTTADTEALDFYSTLFGWVDDPQPMRPGMVYHMQKARGLEAAAIYQQGEEETNQGVPPHWTIYFTVKDVDEITGKAGQSGGTVVFGPMDVFDAGRMAMLQDPQGAIFALWQPKDHIGARAKNEPGALTWTELLTTDAQNAEEFYAGLFGLTADNTGEPMNYTIFRVEGEDVAGLMEITEEMGSIPPNWMVYFSVESVDDSVRLAESLGGKVLTPPMDIPNIGRFATLQDPQGATFSIFSGG